MNEYQAGECNIGAQEVKVRYIMCILALIATSGCVLLIHWYKSHILLYLLTYLAFSNSILAALQAVKKFCVKHALSGRFNFHAFGKSEQVCNVHDRKRDVQKARTMIAISYIFGLVFLFIIFVLCDYHKL